MIVAASDARIALISAGAVLAGVLIGGLINAATTWFFERRRESAEIRQARRLVAEELRTIWMHLDLLSNHGTAPTVPIRPEERLLPSAKWDEYGPTLARHLDDRTWDALSPFMSVIPTHRAQINRLPPGAPLSEDQRRYAQNGLNLSRSCFSLLTGRRIDEV